MHTDTGNIPLGLTSIYEKPLAEFPRLSAEQQIKIWLHRGGRTWPDDCGLAGQQQGRGQSRILQWQSWVATHLWPPTSRLPVPSLGQHLPIVPCHKSSDKMIKRILGKEELILLTAWATLGKPWALTTAMGTPAPRPPLHEGSQQTPLMFHGCYSYIPLTAASHVNTTASAEQ